MMMMNSSSQAGGLLQQEEEAPIQSFLSFGSEQDFCYGAKELNCSHPHFSSTPPSSSISTENLDEWMEVRDALGGDVKETFSDVILPDTDFSAVDLFDDTNSLFFGDQSFGNISGDRNLSSSKICDPTPVPQLTCGDKNDKLTIKLKKVSIRKNKKHKIENPVYAVSDPVAVEPRSSDSKGKFKNTFAPIEDSNAFDFNNVLPVVENSNLNTVESSFPILDGMTWPVFEDSFSTIEYPTVQNSDEDGLSGLTLREALDMEDADSLIDHFITASDSSPKYVDQWSECSSFQDQSSVSLPYSPSSDGGGNSSGVSEEFSDAPSPFNSSDVMSPERSEALPQGRSSLKAKKQKLSPESRYLRKKEQNKQAALRYRVKKKQEDELLSNELKKEEEENERLQKNYSNLQQELSFIKKLMKETLIAKRIVPPNTFD